MWSSFSKAWPIMPVVVVKWLYYSQQVKGESPHNLPLFFLPFYRLQAIVWDEGKKKNEKKNFLLSFWRVSCCASLLRRDFDVLSFKWWVRESVGLRYDRLEVRCPVSEGSFREGVFKGDWISFCFHLLWSPCKFSDICSEVFLHQLGPSAVVAYLKCALFSNSWISV